MSSIAKSDVNKALELAGKTIIEAGGADKRISRAEVKKALGSLEGTEKKLVDVFFKFIDHRDFKKGATVTVKDVQRALSYAKTHLIAKYDLDNNDLSRAEISKMSLTGKLAVDLARSLKAASATPLVRDGETWSDLQDRMKVTLHDRITSATGVDATLKRQIIEACHQSTYTDVRTLADAFGTVDQGEFLVTHFQDPGTGKKYVAVDYGAGDNTYGAIFEEGKTRVAVGIGDGDLYPR